MINKYKFEFDKKVLESTEKRLIGQLWKLIPMRENNEDWKDHLNNTIIEIAGLSEIYSNSPFLL